MNRLGDSGVHRLGDTSAIVNRRGMIRMDCVGIVFEFYIAPLFKELCIKMFYSTMVEEIDTTLHF